MVTVVLTSCGRVGLLQRTLNSFVKFNTYPIGRFIIIDDSGDKEVHHEITEYAQAMMIHVYPGCITVLNNPENIGLIQSIDKAYSQVTTPYIFHCEDDWLFLKSGFIEDSIKILENFPEIMQVWIRSDQNPNGHPIEPELKEINGVKYKLVGTHQHQVWHGFTFNPGLRRLKEYQLIAPYDDIHLDENRGIGVQENHIGRVLYEQYGFRAATLIPEYCVHIGGEQRTYADPSKQNK